MASVNATGLVTGASTGTAYITYSLPTTCYASLQVTVNPLPGPITGISNLCTGSSITLSDAGGGTWSTTSGTATLVPATRVITGVSAGTAVVTYTLPTGCFITATLTVNASPSAILGSRSLCSGGSSTLSDLTGAGTWSSLSIGVATISGTGGVTGVASGNSLISYTTSNGCAATTIVTVNPSPTPIAGVAHACTGATTSLTDAMAGGTWASGTPAVATIGTSGLVTAISAGTSLISYVSGLGCIATQMVTINVTPLPITGTNSVCAGAATGLTDAVVGGTWTSATPANASVSTEGLITGLVAGTTIISYSLSGGCVATAVVTVNPAPTPITGTDAVCAGSGTALSDAVPGGTWNSAAPANASVSAAGFVNGLVAGTATISYSLSAGCTATAIVTVNPAPGPIAGIASVCAGGSAALSDAVTGGTWSSSAPANATVGTEGMVTGLVASTAIISYSLTGGCTATATFTVNSAPAPITGAATECIGSNAALSDVSPGGAWSASATGIATVGTTGAVTGISAGTTIISYILPSACYTTLINTVNPLPSPITGAGGVCVGSATPLVVSPAGGNWMSSNTSVATADTGVLTALSGGTADITYTLATGCSSMVTISVNTTPGAITGIPTLCAGAITNLSDVGIGGTWNSSTPGIATVATIGASSGVVIGVAAGIDTISYIVTPGCLAITLVTVYAVPALSVTATHAACGSNYDLVAAGALSYMWSPAAGIVCGTCATNTINPVATTIYTVTGTGTNGCTATETIPVNANRIMGHVIAGGSAADVLKVWLMQFNPADSTLITQDSMLTCSDGGLPYYEFNGVPAGSYLVRSVLLSGVPGVSGYAPSYGLSSPYWDTAVVITHGSATDTQHINMIYGLVPAGAGTISGLIVTDAGAPAAGMLVYLMNSANQVLTYTYADGTGEYTFSGLADGSYFIYPEEYKYYTTESSAIPLSTADEVVTGISFKQYISRGTITQYNSLTVSSHRSTPEINIYPNPSSGQVNIEWQQQVTGDAAFIITDVAGQEVYRSSIDINVVSGKAHFDISELKEGVYLLSIKSANINFNKKLVVE